MERIWSELEDLIGKFSDHLGKPCPLRSRYPLFPQAAILDAEQFHELSSLIQHFDGFFITFQVMAFTEVSTGDQYAVGPSLKRPEDERRGKHAGAH